jgi:hypothetical protein
MDDDKRKESAQAFFFRPEGQYLTDHAVMFPGSGWFRQEVLAAGVHFPLSGTKRGVLIGISCVSAIVAPTEISPADILD